VYVRRLDPSVLESSLSLYRHPSICILFTSHFNFNNKHQNPYDIPCKLEDVFREEEVRVLQIRMFSNKGTVLVHRWGS
jgi:hypothetical protein